MEKSPNEDRAIIVNQIVSLLSDHQGGRMRLEKFDADAGTIQVIAYPDETQQDAGNRFLVTVKHQLPPSGR